MNKNKLTVGIFVLLVLNDFLETFTHYCFKKGAMTQPAFHLSHWPDALTFVASMLSSGYVWLGILSVVIIFAGWSSILSKVDLSVATPIASFSYVLIALTGWIFFHEYISPLRWVGIFLILAGVAAVSMGPSKDKAGTP